MPPAEWSGFRVVDVWICREILGVVMSGSLVADMDLEIVEIE